MAFRLRHGPRIALKPSTGAMLHSNARATISARETPVLLRISFQQLIDLVAEIVAN